MVRNLVDAAKRHDIKQFVILAAANTGPFEDHRKIARTGYVLYWKTKGEEHLKASGVPFTIVGASGLRNEPREGPVCAFSQGQTINGQAMSPGTGWLK